MNRDLLTARKDLQEGLRQAQQRQAQQRQAMADSIRSAGHRAIDRMWSKQQSWLTRWSVRVWRPVMNAFAKCLIDEAHERGLIDAEQQHALCAMVDRRLWPARH